MCQVQIPPKNKVTTSLPRLRANYWYIISLKMRGPQIRVPINTPPKFYIDAKHGALENETPCEIMNKACVLIIIRNIMKIKT